MRNQIKIENCFREIKWDEDIHRKYDDAVGYNTGIALDTIHRLTKYRTRLVNFYEEPRYPDDRIVKAAVHLIFEHDGIDLVLQKRCFNILGQAWNEQRVRVLRHFPHGPTLKQYAQAIGMWRRGDHNWVWQRDGLAARLVDIHNDVAAGGDVLQIISSNIKPGEYKNTAAIAVQSSKNWTKIIKGMDLIQRVSYICRDVDAGIDPGVSVEKHIQPGEYQACVGIIKGRRAGHTPGGEWSRQTCRAILDVLRVRLDPYL